MSTSDTNESFPAGQPTGTVIATGRENIGHFAQESKHTGPLPESIVGHLKARVTQIRADAENFRKVVTTHEDFDNGDVNGAFDRLVAAVDGVSQALFANA